MNTLSRAVLNKAFSPGFAGGEGEVRGGSENRRVVVVRSVAPSLFALSPASGGERNGWGRTLRARQVYWIGAEARA